MTANDIYTAILDNLKDGRAKTAYTIALEIGASMGDTKKALTDLIQQKKVILTQKRQYQISSNTSQPSGSNHAYAQSNATPPPPPTTPTTHNQWSADWVAYTLISIAISLIVVSVITKVLPEWMIHALPYIGVGIVLMTLACIGLTVHLIPLGESWIIYRMGKRKGEHHPGLVFVFPFVDQIIKVGTRDHIMRISHAQCITHDNVIVEIDFAIFWQVSEAVLTTTVTGPEQYLQLRALALLRDVLALIQSNEVQNQREYASTVLSQKLLSSSQKWGVHCTVEILEIKVPHPF
jgi:hypothetical protein